MLAQVANLVPPTLAPPKPAVPCFICQTTEGYRDPESGRYVRYRGHRFGLDGDLCSTCRYREVRHAKAKKVGRRWQGKGRTWVKPAAVNVAVAKPVVVPVVAPAVVSPPATQRGAVRSTGIQPAYLPSPETIAKRAKAARVESMGPAWAAFRMAEDADDARREGHARRAAMERAAVLFGRRKAMSGMSGLGLITGSVHF